MSQFAAVEQAQGPQNTNAVRILIVDDSAVMRECLHWILEDEHGWKVCGEAANGAEAVEKAIELRPDVIMLDVYMPVMNGFEAARKIRREMPRETILMMSSYDNTQAREEARNVGARGFLVKSGEAPKLIEAVQAVLSDESSFFASAPSLGDPGEPPTIPGQ